MDKDMVKSGMDKYKTEQATEGIISIVINNRANEGYKPLLITPVNMISPNELDENGKPKRYFYYLIVFELADIERKE